MGITGLLPLLKSIHRPCNIKKFSGQTLGVDAYVWLHRGAVACAIDLALEKPTRRFVEFAMNRVRMLQHFGVRPYLVFDGDYLPSKAGTESARSSRRKESRRLGTELLRMGQPSQAQAELQKSIDVTPEMARQLIDELKRAGVDYVVAPYEADAQLVYLERKGIINGMISEDSDLLVFGARILITKLDQYGDCVMINRDEFSACREVSLVGWSGEDFRRMAILSGCDYLPSINNMGLKTAYRLLRKHKTVEKLLRAVQFDGKFKVPPGYLEAFWQAEQTFLYQWVFCPEARTLVNATEAPSDVSVQDLSFIGKRTDPAIASGVASGDLHPTTKEPITVGIAPATHRWAPKTPSGKEQVEQSETKKSKSIDSFFKPYRQPLAELDPNSFNASPSQQQLLQQNPVSWTARPAPNRPATIAPTLTRSQSTTQVPASVPRLRTTSSAASTTTNPPPKRPRLGSAPSSALSDTVGHEGPKSSPYFASTPSVDKNSLGLSSTKSRRRKSAVQIWSDTPAELPSMSNDENPQEEEASTTTVFQKRILRFEKSSADAETWQDESDSRTRRSAGLACTVAKAQGGASLTRGISSTKAIVDDQIHEQLPPLQLNELLHIEESIALTRTITQSAPKGKPSDDLPALTFDDSGIALDDSTWGIEETQVHAAEVLVPDSSPLKAQPTLVGGADDEPIRGSEDMLVPESESEDCGSPTTTGASSRPTFNMGRFRFRMQ